MRHAPRSRTISHAILLATALGALASGPAAPGVPGEPLTEAEFARLHRAALPGAERWAEIPWETDLQAARARAVRERKPLFLWIMDGHPLGCT